METICPVSTIQSERSNQRTHQDRQVQQQQPFTELFFLLHRFKNSHSCIEKSLDNSTVEQYKLNMYTITHLFTARQLPELPVS
jgi:hypothetical protein